MPAGPVHQAPMSSSALDDALATRRNRFDTIRVAAAVGVVLSHAFPATHGSNAADPVSLLSGGQLTLGSVGVAAFFVISGLLVTRSAERSPTLWRFAWARVLRIYPGLVVCLAAIVLVLGPAFTPLPLAVYFTEASTYAYVPRNASLFFKQDGVGALFGNHPYPGLVNGSLWTLAYEVGFYVFVGVLTWLRACRPAVIATLWAAAAAYLAWRAPGPLSSREYWPALFLYFGSGMLWYLWRPHVRPRPSVAWVCAAGVGVAMLSGRGAAYALATAGAYAIVTWGASVPARTASTPRDVSYGLYIYGFPLQQAVVAMVPGCPWWLNVAIALPLAYGCALASWRFVEAPCLRWKDAFTRSRPPRVRPPAVIVAGS